MNVKLPSWLIIILTDVLITRPTGGVTFASSIFIILGDIFIELVDWLDQHDNRPFEKSTRTTPTISVVYFFIFLP